MRAPDEEPANLARLCSTPLQCPHLSLHFNEGPSLSLSPPPHRHLPTYGTYLPAYPCLTPDPPSTPCPALPRAAADMNAWVKISIGMGGATALVTAWVVYLESNHEHHHSPDRCVRCTGDALPAARRVADGLPSCRRLP